MIDKSQLSESEVYELKRMVLEKKKEQLEKEIESLKNEPKTIDRDSLIKIGNYFKNWLQEQGKWLKFQQHGTGKRNTKEKNLDFPNTPLKM